MRIVFFGSPEPARIVLASLVESEHDIVAVITQPDKRRGRGSALMPTPVKEVAVAAGIDVYTPAKKSEIDEVVQSLNADVGVVVAYGKIVSETVLNHFKYGCINIHYSLLPRWRGAAPVERAILAGDNVTGVSIMKMSVGLDEGPVYATRQVDITDETTSESLFRSMNAISGDMLQLVLSSLETEQPQEQVGVETYAHKLTKEDFEVSKETSVVDVDRKVRAGSLIKGAHFSSGGETLRILQTSQPHEDAVSGDVGTLSRQGILTCIDGTIQCVRIQAPGKPVMEFEAWANGVDQSRFPIRIDS